MFVCSIVIVSLYFVKVLDCITVKTLCFGSSKEISPWGQLCKNNLRKIVIIFLSISLNMCFGCSKELSHQDGSFEYPQHMFG